jgi:hypothetical protein
MFKHRREQRVALNNCTCIKDLVLFSLYQNVAYIWVTAIIIDLLLDKLFQLLGIEKVFIEYCLIMFTVRN